MRVRFGAMRLVSRCPSFYNLTNFFLGGGHLMKIFVLVAPVRARSIKEKRKAMMAWSHRGGQACTVGHGIRMSTSTYLSIHA
jgi:hypothetical protein